jgi:hypothetical protein
MKTYVHLIRLFELILEWEILGQICRENQHTHFKFNHLFPKTVPFMW